MWVTWRHRFDLAGPLCLRDTRLERVCRQYFLNLAFLYQTVCQRFLPQDLQKTLHVQRRRADGELHVFPSHPSVRSTDRAMLRLNLSFARHRNPDLCLRVWPDTASPARTCHTIGIRAQSLKADRL